MKKIVDKREEAETIYEDLYTSWKEVRVTLACLRAAFEEATPSMIEDMNLQAVTRMLRDIDHLETWVEKWQAEIVDYEAAREEWINEG